MPVDPTSPATARRRVVVEGAAQLLAEQGPAAVSVRRLAELAGGSTQLIYTLFGGKQGVADALHAEGFHRMGRAIGAALLDGGEAGSAERLFAMAHAYRDFALSNPYFFTVMFGPAVPSFSPTEATRAVGREQTLGRVVSEVQACLDSGALVAGTSEDIAQRSWACIHGLVVLELANMVEGAQPELVDRLLDGVLHPHLNPAARRREAAGRGDVSRRSPPG